MEFRWVAAMTLWTMLSGPVLVQLAAYSPFATRPAARVAAPSRAPAQFPTPTWAPAHIR